MPRDITVVGAGPAGLAAAWAAAEAGARVRLLDDNPRIGGQIWRGGAAGVWAERIRRPEITLELGRPVTGELAARPLILATGTRERFLPFPGWTLPHVFGAGGLQAMVKGGMPIEGRRVVVCGSGPLLVAVGSFLRKRGARVLVVAEQAPAARIRSFARDLWRTPGKALEAARLGWGLRYRTGAWPVEAGPGSVTLRQGGRDRRYETDYVACGFGLVVNTELAQLHGCALEEGRVTADSRQRTTVEGIWWAGGGSVERSTAEGVIAGFEAAGAGERAQPWRPARERARRFERRLDQAFRLREELLDLPQPATIVCRCEDVPYGRIQSQRDGRAAKLQTRCGMGPCQGRVCGPAVEFLLGWNTGQPRPPLYPVRADELLD